MDEWWTSQDVADRYRVPLATVRQWRLREVGPKGVRLGRHVRYSERSLQEWESQQGHSPSAA